jgi:hypothetical protein
MDSSDTPARAGTDPAADLTDRRVRSLAHLLPILELERNKNAGGSGRDWSVYDVKLLTVTAVDHVAIDSGLAGQTGSPRDELLAAITKEASLCAPDRPADEHAAVARWLLDSLLNRGDDAISHEVAYVSAAHSHAHRTLRVRLLYETQAEDGETILVNVDQAAVHLLVSALDRNLADAQVAADAVLKVQLETGRLDDAVGVARQALIISRQYRAQLRSYLTSVEQSLQTVDWEGQVEPALEAALAHVTSRVHVERELLTHAAGSRLDDDPAGSEATATWRRRAGEIHTLMGECLQTHAELQADLIGARDRFRAEQARQAFAPPTAIAAVDLTEDVLVPLLRRSVDDVAGQLDAMMNAFCGTAAPTLPSFGLLADTLTRSRPEPEEAGEAEEFDLDDLDLDLSRFDERHHQAVASLTDTVEGPIRLSELLQRVEDRIDDETFAYEVALLAALTVLRTFSPDGPEPSRWAATDDGRRLATRHIPDAPDLLLHPPTAGQETHDDIRTG